MIMFTLPQNPEVIQFATIPNINKNLRGNPDVSWKNRVQLFSGDWLDFVQFLFQTSQNPPETDHGLQ